jgi:hypothetical protein
MFRIDPTNPSIRQPITSRRSPRPRSNRRTPRNTVLPPDYLHGAYQLDEMYAAFGASWVHGASFIRTVESPSGPRAMMAFFDDYFLECHHFDRYRAAIGLDADPFAAWLQAHHGTRHTAVRLMSDPNEPRLSLCPEVHQINIHCPPSILRQLENQHLGISREFGAGVVDLKSLETDLLSFIGLCARLSIDGVSEDEFALGA